MTYAVSDNQQFSSSFQGSNSYIPHVGTFQNKYENFGDFTQAKYNSTTQVVAGDPVIVVNQVGTTADEVAIENMNALGAEITDKATAMTDISGFIVKSETDVVPLAGGEAYPVKGFLSFVAMLGSGAELYLPADSTLEGVNVNSAVTYDFSNKCLVKARVGTDVELPVRIKSALVNAKQLVYSGGTATWTDCKAVLVQLSNHLQTKSSS